MPTSDRERITDLEAQCRGFAREIDTLRDAKHKHANILTAHGLIIKFACAVSGIGGTVVGGVVVKWLGA